MNVSTESTLAVSSAVESAFPFSVLKRPLNGFLGTEKLQTPFYGLFRDDTWQTVGNAFSSRYVPHTTDDVKALAEACGHAFDDSIDVQCHFRDAHHVRIAPTNAQRRDIFGSVDAIFPRVFIRFGFDGRACLAGMGYYRDLCRNLAMLDSVKACKVSIRHTSKLRAQMDSLVETFSELRNSYSTLSSVIDKMQDTTVNTNDSLAEVFGDKPDTVGRGLTQYENKINAIKERIARERKQTGRGILTNEISGWELYNGVQGYYQWDATKKTGLDSDFDRIINATAKLEVKKTERLVLSLSA